MRLCKLVKSLRFDTCFLDQFAPFRGLLDGELVEISWGSNKRRACHVSDACGDHGIGKPRVDLLIELIDDRAGRILGSSDPNPPGDLVLCVPKTLSVLIGEGIT